MKTRIQPLLSAVLLAGVTVAAGSAGLQARADEPPPPTATTDADDPPATTRDATGGLSGNLYFTDENGNPRNPTAAELITLAKGFQKDLARLAGKHYGKPNVRTEPSGAVAATVATSQLAFLTATENEDGTVTISHSTSNGDGDVPARPPLPEK